MKEDYPLPSDQEIEDLYAQLEREARQGGYNLNPDREFTRGLVRGLLINERRYGYRACPCRLAADDRDSDMDIICPCYYRDPDVVEFGACYCALYVSRDVLSGKLEVGPVPERRPSLEERSRIKERAPPSNVAGPLELSVPVWRCLVCGYLCGRNEPPEICPICKAGKDRFERFI